MTTHGGTPTTMTARPHPSAAAAAVAADPLLIDLPRAAELLGISVKSVRRLVEAGDLPGVRRIGRRVLLSVAELRGWVAAGCQPGRARRGQAAQRDGRPG
jgi:excisionase family DNA binding protein